MDDSTSKRPQHPSRRTHPHGGKDAPGDAPRRAVGESDRSALTTGRGADQTGVGTAGSGGKWWRGRGWWVVAVAVIALLGLVLSLVIGPSADTTTRQRAVPVSTPAGTPVSSGTSTVPPPSVVPDPSVATTSPLPEDPGPPLPGTAVATPAVTEQPQPAEPEPTATIEAGDIQLNDARFSAPPGWSIYADEQIEDSRRAVRLSKQDTDVRLQAVTLGPSGQGLGSACSSLVELQQAQFTGVEKQLVAPIGIDAQLGSALRCGFDGIRASDGVPNSVTFTLVSRAVDSHVLMLRTTVPQESLDAAPVVAQLNAMTCEASSSFGVPLPLC